MARHKGEAPPRERDAPVASERAAKRQLNLRLTPQTYDQVQGVALLEGRTLNSAAEELLRRGHAADRKAIDIFGSVAGFAVARALLAAAEAAVVKNGADQGLWLHDPDFFDQAAAAIHRTLETLRPGPVQQALAEVEDARRRAS